MIVVDASALLEVLLQTPSAPHIERRLFDRRQSLHAPHLLDVEIAQVLRRYAAHRDIDIERGSLALTDLTDFPIHRYPHHFLLGRVWELRDTFSAYDGVYVALAEVLDATLLTSDRRLAGSAARHVRVEAL